VAGETKTQNITGPYLPAPNGEALAFNITVTNASARLAALLPGAIIPTIRNPEADPQKTGDPSAGVKPNHMFIQVPVGATNKVYITWDNVTVPVAVDGGPGFELQPGVVYPFENARNLLTAVSGAAYYNVNAGSAFQIISKTGNQAVSVWFCN